MYEFARQTLLVEQIIASNNREFKVDDYMHLVVIPEGNVELRGMISELYIPTLKDKEKFIISTPKYLLRDIKSPHIDYVRERYW